MTDPASYQVHHNGPLKPEIIKFLNDLRVSKNWTYKALGDRLGISQAFAHNLLNKKGNISTSTYMTRVARGIERLQAGDTAKPEEAPVEGDTIAMRDHAYHLRDDLQVVLRLPADLTEREAQRLSLFIQSLAQ
ncbi:hypothetical protein SCH01S_14_00250 [Sphingomonas changbaiensis NBRC 104936]|uniref:Uncharacterized protein n=1 Tax=Sphingomonas changbaiensis NBRC 104936 TaxID=1219043 RepID=A0A0E9MLS9_9SPHN|nr:helix-turn-helix transcriptional regulator [Sphingomonas changbaiensis]GAO38361.1 hypothetical protein SCH01S_14_00250 [Sphingomonas changbaiensis NBRC 104936]